VSANGVSFGRICKDCEQKARNEKKNADRPRAIIEQRASVAASKVGATREFFMIQMNYRALIPELRALMSNEGLCKGCGHDFINERDIQIEHIEPIRFDKDWARLHARNIRLFCASCNGTKGHKPFGQWLDEQEGARLSNLQEPTPIRILAQMNLFN
jgi:5-methylcytosine-specific restriction endonuclease McrA